MDEGQDGEFSSGSDTEESARGKQGKQGKEGSAHNMDIQVSLRVQPKMEKDCNKAGLKLTTNISHSQKNSYMLQYYILYWVTAYKTPSTKFILLFYDTHIFAKHN